MQLTKFKHSCVRIDDGDRSIVLDPGVFSDVAPALDGATAILITHEHADHVDEAAIRAAAQADSRLQIFGPESAVRTFADLGEQVLAVQPGLTYEIAGLRVQTFGGQHALLHPQIPVVANIAYLVNDAVYHPGDSLVVPPAPVKTLLLPAMAPWATIANIIDFAVAVRAPRALPIHDAIVTEAYHGILRRNLDPIVAPFGVQLQAFDATLDA